MALSKATITRLRSASAREGGTVYEKDQAPEEVDATHFEEDDDPLSNVGDVDEDEDQPPVGEVPDEEEGKG